MSITTAGSKLRIALKEIETLSYACTNQGTLVEITKSLEEVKSHFISKLPTQEGLVMQSAGSLRRMYAARMLKKKYGKLRTKKQCKKQKRRKVQSCIFIMCITNLLVK